MNTKIKGNFELLAMESLTSIVGGGHGHPHPTEHNKMFIGEPPIKPLTYAQKKFIIQCGAGIVGGIATGGWGWLGLTACLP
ncbi:TPA: hypothetical protein ACGOWW_001927 [Streptococcus suis]|nr:hypothetical protein [Streptococcus suis]